MENVKSHGTRSDHTVASLAKYVVLLVGMSMLWVQFHSLAELIVPVHVRPTSEQWVDRVKLALLKVGAPPQKVDELASAIRGASTSAQVSPILLVALMYTENESFDYKAVSYKGYKGLIQTPWASMRWADVDTLLGAKILRDKLELTNNDLLEALRLYKGGKNPTATRQAKRTIEVYEGLLEEENKSRGAHHGAAT